MSTLPPHTNPTQADAILLHLRGGGRLTPIHALNLFGCFRLGARVHELNKTRDAGIQKVMKEVPCQETGRSTRVAEYFIPKTDEREPVPTPFENG